MFEIQFVYAYEWVVFVIVSGVTVLMLGSIWGIMFERGGNGMISL